MRALSSGQSYIGGADKSMLLQRSPGSCQLGSDYKCKIGLPPTRSICSFKTAMNQAEGSAGSVNLNERREDRCKILFRAVTMSDGFEAIAKILYYISMPKHYATASEAATM